MRRALLVLMLASCSSEEECAPAAYRVVDAAKGCIGAETFGSDCSYGSSGPPTIRCSVAPDGRMVISYEGRTYPGGRLCTPEEEKTVPTQRCP